MGSEQSFEQSRVCRRGRENRRSNCAHQQADDGGDDGDGLPDRPVDPSRFRRGRCLSAMAAFRSLISPSSLVVAFRMSLVAALDASSAFWAVFWMSLLLSTRAFRRSAIRPVSTSGSDTGQWPVEAWGTGVAAMDSRTSSTESVRTVMESTAISALAVAVSLRLTRETPTSSIDASSSSTSSSTSLGVGRRDRKSWLALLERFGLEHRECWWTPQTLPTGLLGSGSRTRWSDSFGAGRRPRTFAVELARLSVIPTGRGPQRR